MVAVNWSRGSHAAGKFGREKLCHGEIWSRGSYSVGKFGRGEK